MRKISILLTGLFISVTTFAQWSLTGNSGTNPPTNFLGTTDAQRLVFKTNATERATILSNGNFGIGTSSPGFLFHVYSTTADIQAGVSGTAPSIHFFSGATASTVSGGRVAFATGSNQFVAGSVSGDFIIQNYDTVQSLLFATNQNVANGEGVERMRINKIGYVGIAQSNPTAIFDVNCSAVSGQSNPSNIRFENLQSGTGTALVIDNNGYVYKQSGALAGAAANSPMVTTMQDQIEELRSQVEELRTLLSTRLALSSTEANRLRNESVSWLGDIHPNPASNATTVDYSLPAGAGSAICQVYSLSGSQVAALTLPVVQGKSQVNINTSQMPAGIYIYALVVDGKVLATKQLAVVR